MLMLEFLDRLYQWVSLLIIDQYFLRLQGVFRRHDVYEYDNRLAISRLRQAAIARSRESRGSEHAARG